MVCDYGAPWKPEDFEKIQKGNTTEEKTGETTNDASSQKPPFDDSGGKGNIQY